MLVRVRGSGTLSLNGDELRNVGTSTMAISSILRRCTSKKKDAFLLMGPPMFPI